MESSLDNVNAALPFLVAARKTIYATPNAPRTQWFATRSAEYLARAIFTLRQHRAGETDMRRLTGASSTELIDPCYHAIVGGFEFFSDDLSQMYLVSEIAASVGYSTDMLDSIKDRRLFRRSILLAQRSTDTPRGPGHGGLEPSDPVQDEKEMSLIVGMWSNILDYAARSGDPRYRGFATDALALGALSYLSYWSLTCDEDNLGSFLFAFA